MDFFRPPNKKNWFDQAVARGRPCSDPGPSLMSRRQTRATVRQAPGRLTGSPVTSRSESRMWPVGLSQLNITQTRHGRKTKSNFLLITNQQSWLRKGLQARSKSQRQSQRQMAILLPRRAKQKPLLARRSRRKLLPNLVSVKTIPMARSESLVPRISTR